MNIDEAIKEIEKQLSISGINGIVGYGMSGDTVIIYLNSNDPYIEKAIYARVGYQPYGYGLYIVNTGTIRFF